jgi:hypothetical protein
VLISHRKDHADGQKTVIPARMAASVGLLPAPSTALGPETRHSAAKYDDSAKPVMDH